MYCAYRKLFLCGTFTIMKFELRFEESRTTKYYWQASAYGYQPLALDDIEIFLCLLPVLCRVIASFHPLSPMLRSKPPFHSLDFMLVPKRT